MADTQEILAAAGKLGELVATHPAIAAYKEILRQLDLDIAAKGLLQQYEQLIETLSAKEAQMQPIEVAEKQQFERLQQSIMMNPTLKKFGTLQGEYMDLMKKVQEVINLGMAGQLPPELQNAAGGAGAAAPSKIILDT